MNVAQMLAATPAMQTQNSTGGAHSRHDARKDPAADKPADGKTRAASGKAHARGRSRERQALAASGSAQWLHVMSQAIADTHPRVGFPSAVAAAPADSPEEGGEAEGKPEQVQATNGVAGADAARQAAAFPADLSAMRDALALIPAGAVLQGLGKTASAALDAPHAEAQDETEAKPADGTARASGGDTLPNLSRQPNEANVASPSGERASNAGGQSAPIARVAERAASGAREGAYASGADSGTRSTPGSQPVATTASNAWNSLNAVQTQGASEWMPVALKGGASQGWNGQLMDALGERIDVQMKHGIDNAVIRLDPPMLGSVQIDIRHENGALQVHLVATHEEVTRQLQTISNALQSELAQKQYTDVVVVVRNGGSMGQGEGRGQPRENESERAPGRALDDAQASGTEHNNAGA
jgi:flagellar hook-length control protein FliK